jgi:hypothetical protein
MIYVDKFSGLATLLFCYLLHRMFLIRLSLYQSEAWLPDKLSLHQHFISKLPIGNLELIHAKVVNQSLDSITPRNQNKDIFGSLVIHSDSISNNIIRKNETEANIVR